MGSYDDAEICKWVEKLNARKSVLKVIVPF